MLLQGYQDAQLMQCPLVPMLNMEDWSMKVVLQSHGETLRIRLKILPVLLMELPMEPRAKVEPGSGEHGVCTHFPKDPNCDTCMKTKITRAS